MGTTFSKLFGNGNKKNNNAEPGAGQSATLPRPTTSKVKVDAPKKSSSFKLPFPKKSKTPSPALTPKSVPKNQENAPSLSPPSPAPIPALNVIDVQIDEEAFKKIDIAKTKIEKVSENVQIIKTDIESVIKEVENEAEEEVENAVVKIQAGVRGFLARKHIKEGSSPDKESGIIGMPSFDNEKRIETPTPSSPIKTTFSILESVPQSEERPEASLEELEILKKVQQINELFAKNDNDVPVNLSSKIDQTANTVIKTVEAVSDELDHCETDSIVVIDSSFIDNVEKSQIKNDVKEVPIQQEVFEQILTQNVPIHVLKSPSIEEEEKEEGEREEKKVLSEEAAAIRIQAAFRGYGVRKSLSREPSPGRDKIDDDAHALFDSQRENEPMIEAVTVEQTETVNTIDSLTKPKELGASTIEENIIVPICIQHEDNVIDLIKEETNNIGTDNDISEENKNDIDALENVVSNDIVSENILKEESVQESLPEALSEIVEEEAFTQIHIVPKENQPVAEKDSSIILQKNIPNEDDVSKVTEQEELKIDVLPITQELNDELIPIVESESEQNEQQKSEEPEANKIETVNSEQNEQQQKSEEPEANKIETVDSEQKSEESDANKNETGASELSEQQSKPEESEENQTKVRESVLNEEQNIQEMSKENKTESELNEQQSMLEVSENKIIEENECESSRPQSMLEDSEENKTEERESELNKEQSKLEMSEEIKTKKEEFESIEQQSMLEISEENKIENKESELSEQQPTIMQASEVKLIEEKESQLEVENEKKTEAQTIENVIESLEDDKGSLVMKIKIGVENQLENEEKKVEGGEESEEDVSASIPVNRESSPVATGNKKRNRNKKQNRKR